MPQPTIWNRKFYEEEKKRREEWAARYAQWLQSLPPEVRDSILSRPFQGQRLSYLMAQAQGNPIGWYKALEEQAKALYRQLERGPVAPGYKLPSQQEFLRRTIGRKPRRPYRHVPDSRLQYYQWAMRHADRVLNRARKRREAMPQVKDYRTKWEKLLDSVSPEPTPISVRTAIGGIRGKAQLVDDPAFTLPLLTKNLDTALAILNDPVVRAKRYKRMKLRERNKPPKPVEQIRRDFQEYERQRNTDYRAKNWRLITRGAGGMPVRRPRSSPI